MPRVDFRFLFNGGGPQVDAKNANVFGFSRLLIEEEPPSVIICNHQSHLDLLYLLSLSEKTVVVTNKWVFKSPVYGNIVRKAGNICIEDGWEANLDQLKKLKEEGCSILVFPEGTRSEDCSILKFKSGAFSLAGELGMDVLPIVLFGPGEVLPKGEHILRRGKVIVEVKDRVPVSSLETYGPRPLKQAQAFRRYYEDEYANLKDKAYSDASFKASRIKDNNLYKSEDEMV